MMAIKNSFLQLCVTFGVTLAAFQGAEVSGQGFFNKIFRGGGEETEDAAAETQEQSAELDEVKKDTISSLSGLYEVLVTKGFPIKDRPPEGEITQILFYLRGMSGIVDDINLRGLAINKQLAILSNETVEVEASDGFNANNFLINLKKVKDNKTEVMAGLVEVKKEIFIIQGMLGEAKEYGFSMLNSLDAFWNTVKDPLVLARYPFDKQMRNEVKEIKGFLGELEPMVKSVGSMSLNLSKAMGEATTMFTGMNIPDPDAKELKAQISGAFEKIFTAAATETQE